MTTLSTCNSLANHVKQGVNVNAALDSGYRVVFCDQSLTSPFALDEELLRRSTTIATQPLHARPRLLYEYLHNKLQYATPASGYRSAMETWSSKRGICGEMTFLYVGMARAAGLAAQYVQVTVDASGKRVKHACAGVRAAGNPLRETSTMTLVDLAYNAYGILHKAWKPLSDEQAWELFKHWRAAKM